MRLKRLNVPVYKQTKDDYACGPVCIAMAIDYLRKLHKRPQLNFAECQKIILYTMNGNLRRKTGTLKDGLKTAIRKIGYHCKELRGKKDRRLKQISNAINKRRNPVILFCHKVIEGKPYPHYIVITYKDNDQLYFNDPYLGKKNKNAIKAFTSRGDSLYWGSSKWGVEISIKN